MKKITIYLFLITFLFSCKKDELTITDIVNPIDSTHCKTKYINLDLDSFLLNWDTNSITPNFQLIELCKCDSIVFSFTNSPDSIQFNAWEIFQDYAWLTYYSQSTPPLTINSLISFSLIDSFGQFIGPYHFFQTNIYDVKFEDCD